MEDNFNGIEEYRNVFPIEYCKQLIETFEQRASMQLTEHQTGFKNQDERIFMDMSNHNNMFHVDADLCKFFYQTVVKTYEEKYGKKFLLHRWRLELLIFYTKTLVIVNLIKRI